MYSSLLSLRISIHAPSRERRNVTVNVGSGGGDFNPRSLTGATSLVHYISTSFNDFNPRSLTGATITQHIKIQHFIISIHAPLRERHGTCIACIQVDTLFQSTLPYGSDRFDCAFTLGIGISIHAPLRERPAATYLGQFLFGISIHAPLRERRTTTSGSFVPSLFQSTLPYGSDIKYRTQKNIYTKISIHAPLRERPASGSFIPTLNLFQSTLPYGSDYCPIYFEKDHRNFNPRSLTGATISVFSISLLITISIHAPLRERLTQSLLVPCRVKFQSTLPYGSDKSQLKQNLPGSISIHAPLRERHNLLRVSLI